MNFNIATPVAKIESTPVADKLNLRNAVLLMLGVMLPTFGGVSATVGFMSMGMEREAMAAAAVTAVLAVCGAFAATKIKA